MAASMKGREMDYGQPAHAEGLLRELQCSADVRTTLLRAVPWLSSDNALMNAFLALSFSPETSDFLATPSRSQALAAISAEYDVRAERCDPEDTGLRQTMSRTYYDLGLGALAMLPSLGPTPEYLLTDLWGTPKKEELTATPQTVSTRPSRYATPRSWTAETDNDGSLRGLKRLSALVRAVVISRPSVTHKEVVTQVLEEVTRSAGGMREREEKNVKRRLYDSINVLIAAGALAKEGRSLVWKGYPGLKPAELQDKEDVLRDLVSRHIAIKHLLLRNSTRQLPKGIPLPFILSVTPDSSDNFVRSTQISIRANQTATSLHLSFAQPSQHLGDMDVLLLLGLDRVDTSTALRLLPDPDLLPFSPAE